MGTVLGFVIGYVVGSKAGDQGYEELRDAWATISSSEEVRDIISGGLAALADVVRQGRSVLAGRLAGAPESLRAA